MINKPQFVDDTMIVVHSNNVELLAAIDRCRRRRAGTLECSTIQAALQRSKDHIMLADAYLDDHPVIPRFIDHSVRFIDHTSNPEFEKLKSCEHMEILRDRTIKVDVPLNWQEPEKEPSMSVITFKKVETRRKTIEPAEGYTTRDVCRLLNDGYATFERLCPLGMTFPHDCTHEEVICLKGDNGHADPSKIIAKVSGHAGSTTGCNWIPDMTVDPVGDSIKEFARHVVENKTDVAK